MTVQHGGFSSQGRGRGRGLRSAWISLLTPSTLVIGQRDKSLLRRTAWALSIATRFLSLPLQRLRDYPPLLHQVCIFIPAQPVASHGWACLQSCVSTDETGTRCVDAHPSEQSVAEQVFAARRSSRMSSTNPRRRSRLTKVERANFTFASSAKEAG